MNKIEQQMDKFSSLDFDKIFKDSVLETKDVLLRIIRDQMLSGKASDGSELGRYAWLEYAEFKRQFTHGGSAPFGIYDLSLTGEFHGSMYIGFDLNSNILIDATDDKTSYLTGLVGRYHGGDGSQLVFGMMDESLSEYRATIYPVLMRKIREHLGY